MKVVWSLLVLILMSTIVPVQAQDVVAQYVVTDFDPGQGLSMAQLKARHVDGLCMIAESVTAAPNRYVNVYCVVDALRFSSGQWNDALNGGTTISRYLWVVDALTEQGVPRRCITQPFPDSDKMIGGDKRRVLIEVVEFSRPVTRDEMEVYVQSQLANLPTRTDTVVVTSETATEDVSGTHVWIGGGLSYVGKRFVPMVWGQLGNDRMRFEAEAGYSGYHQQRTFIEELSVVYRYVHVGIVWRPDSTSTLDLLAGWQRFETYALDYGQYAERLEGPTLGIRLGVTDNLLMTGRWTPAEVSRRGSELATWDAARMSISLVYFTTILGGVK